MKYIFYVVCANMHGKNDFATVSKNLARYTDLKIILDHQDNYVKMFKH